MKMTAWIQLSAEGMRIPEHVLRMRLYRGLIPMPQRRVLTARFIEVLDPPLSLDRGCAPMTVKKYRSRKSSAISSATKTAPPAPTVASCGAF